jgi:hypothetical protein
MSRPIYPRRIHITAALLYISKEESAKLQLKYLPNPLKQFPKKKTAYNLFVKARLAQSKGIQLNKISKQLGNEWRVDRDMQNVFNTN